ncbi:peptidylprolyl isomerase [Shewanella sp. Isolate8]|uniref:peptidylprolyl isomerase n=1 Tax=Shewanella sp. Isolate8 TaxID=2908529 RepID=UPI001EFD1C82|nr:peptidylprolyl isomerase [Shewanella sp. Isolate8]MCG9745355.1 peptidylprolyl isomerase [Shewanella sp. Isolate8]
MKKQLRGKLVLGALLLLGLSGCGSEAGSNGVIVNPPVTGPVPDMSIDACFTMTTSLGEVGLGIDSRHTPQSAANFIGYVDAKFYDGTLIHRVIHNFIIQGGGFTSGMVPKPGGAPISNEASVGFSNLRGTLAMARGRQSDSATSQFFINILDNPQLDYSASSPGYAVFGKVLFGMEVVDQIGIVATTRVGEYSDFPLEEVVIERIAPSECPIVED